MRSMEAFRKAMHSLILLGHFLLLCVLFGQLGLWAVGSRIGTNIHLFSGQERDVAFYVMIAVMAALVVRFAYELAIHRSFSRADASLRGSLQVSLSTFLTYTCSILWLLYR